LCGNLNGKNFKAKRFSYELLDGQITVYNLPRAIKHFGPFLSTSIFVLIYYFYLRSVKKIDLVHSHGHLGVWFLVYKKLFGSFDTIPLVGHYHITAKGRERAMKKQGSKLGVFSKYFEYPIHRFSDSLMSKTANHLVAVAQNVLAEVQEFYSVPNSKITLLESGVNVDNFHKDGVRNRYGIPENKILLATSGRLSQRKNVDVVVKALSQLEDKYHLILQGFWEPEYKDLVQKIIDEKKLKDRISYIGLLELEDIPSLMRTIDIMVMPSSYEGLPKVVVEALASGAKVITSGFDMSHKIPELYITDGLSPNELAKFIKEVQTKSVDYEKTRKIIVKFYSWDSKARDLEKIYEKLV